MQSPDLHQEVTEGLHFRASRFPDSDLPVAINDGDGHQDTGTASKGTHQVRRDREDTEDGTTEGGSGRDDAFEFLVHGLLTVTGHDHLLLLELLGDVSWTGTRNFDPGLGKEGAGGKHESDVDDGVDGVEESGLDRRRGRHVVGDSRDGMQLARVLDRLRIGISKLSSIKK